MRGIPFDKQYPMSVCYKGIEIDCGYRIDLWVEKLVIVELKAIESFAPIHEAQIMTYMKLANNRLGLLLNFNVTRLRQGIKRIIL